MRNRSTPLLPTLLQLFALFATALLLAGCGGGGPSASDYEAGLERMQAQLDEANEASRASGETVDVEERRAKLGEAHDAIDAAATTAEQLEPPEDAEEAHAKLAGALRDYATLFDKLARLEANSPEESALYSEAGEIVKRLDDANRALEKAGYTVDEDAGE